jgi:hypothetical protein
VRHWPTISPEAVGRTADSRAPPSRTQRMPSRTGQRPSEEPAVRLTGNSRAGGPPLTISARTIPTEGAPSLRSLQGWAAMLPTQLLSVLHKPTAYAFLVPHMVRTLFASPPK